MYIENRDKKQRLRPYWEDSAYKISQIGFGYMCYCTTHHQVSFRTWANTKQQRLCTRRQNEDTEARDPEQKRNVSSYHILDTAAQNSRQNLSATLTAVLLPAPAGPVRNISSCSIPPRALRCSTS